MYDRTRDGTDEQTRQAAQSLGSEHDEVRIRLVHSFEDGEPWVHGDVKLRRSDDVHLRVGTAGAQEIARLLSLSLGIAVTLEHYTTHGRAEDVAAAANDRRVRGTLDRLEINP